jgi:hypothetical protein
VLLLDDHRVGVVVGRSRAVTLSEDVVTHDHCSVTEVQAGPSRGLPVRRPDRERRGQAEVHARVTECGRVLRRGEADDFVLELRGDYAVIRLVETAPHLEMDPVLLVVDQKPELVAARVGVFEVALVGAGSDECRDRRRLGRGLQRVLGVCRLRCHPNRDRVDSLPAPLGGVIGEDLVDDDRRRDEHEHCRECPEELRQFGLHGALLVVFTEDSRPARISRKREWNST